MDHIITQSELTDLLYATIFRELDKDENEINTALINECMDILDKLDPIDIPDNEEIFKKAMELIRLSKTKKARRKSFKAIRLIAAIVTLFIVLGVAAYMFFDELEARKEEFAKSEPGVYYKDGKFDFEVSENKLIFSTIEEMTEYIKEPIWLPAYIPDDYSLSNATVTHFEEYDEISLVWSNKTNRITYSIELKCSPYTNKEQLIKYCDDYTSPQGHLYAITTIEDLIQANALIDDSLYTIKADNHMLLKGIIESMKEY